MPSSEPFKDLHALHYPFESGDFYDRRGMVPLHRPFHGLEVDGPFPHRIMAVGLPVVVMEVDMGEGFSEESGEAPVQVGMANVECKPLAVEKGELIGAE